MFKRSISLGKNFFRFVSFCSFVLEENIKSGHSIRRTRDNISCNHRVTVTSVLSMERCASNKTKLTRIQAGLSVEISVGDSVILRDSTRSNHMFGVQPAVWQTERIYFLRPRGRALDLASCSVFIRKIDASFPFQRPLTMRI